ncbi:MAG: hypothetical protein LBE24_04070 [Methylobacillus sp.]|jgi:hypothetical protein|nr:hypothetical protein [Methylobacillus sp.]
MISTTLPPEARTILIRAAYSYSELRLPKLDEQTAYCRVCALDRAIERVIEYWPQYFVAHERVD